MVKIIRKIARLYLPKPDPVPEDLELAWAARHEAALRGDDLTAYDAKIATALRRYGYSEDGIKAILRTRQPEYQ